MSHIPQNGMTYMHTLRRLHVQHIAHQKHLRPCETRVVALVPMVDEAIASRFDSAHNGKGKLHS